MKNKYHLNADEIIKRIECPKCGSINIKKATGKLKQLTTKEKGNLKKSGFLKEPLKLHYCRHCKHKF